MQSEVYISYTIKDVANTQPAINLLRDRRQKRDGE